MDEPSIATSADAETAHKIDRKSARSPRIEVITRNDRRQVWTLEQKREIVPEGTVKLSGLGLGETSRVGYRPLMTTSRDPLYTGYRYPGDLISYAVWLYFRFR